MAAGGVVPVATTRWWAASSGLVWDDWESVVVHTSLVGANAQDETSLGRVGKESTFVNARPAKGPFHGEAYGFGRWTVRMRSGWANGEQVARRGDHGGVVGLNWSVLLAFKLRLEVGLEGSGNGLGLVWLGSGFRGFIPPR